MSFSVPAVYTRNPAAYDALKGFNILKLPSVSSLKTFTGCDLEAHGDIHKRLSESYQYYQNLISTKVQVEKQWCSQKGALGARAPPFVGKSNIFY